MAKFKTGPSYSQGELDLLCGVYSVLNILQLLRPKCKAESRKLFYKMLRYLEKSKCQKLSITITNGLTFKDMKQLLNAFLSTETLEWTLPFPKKSVLDMDQYWNTLRELLRSNNESCVLIRLKGTYNHWTIVKSMTEHTITLYDSDGLVRINRRSCSIYYSQISKPHLLWPKYTVFIFRSQSNKKLHEHLGTYVTDSIQCKDA